MKRPPRLRISTALFLLTLTVGCATDPYEKYGQRIDDPVLRAFALQVQAAIDKEKRCPPEAVSEHRQGVAVISFDYIDGIVSNYHLDESSGSQSLDDAAMEAVKRAKLPPKPAYLTGLNRYIVVLNFKLN